MANDRAVERNTIIVDNKTYWARGKVRLFDAGQQPGKIVIGESSAADNPHASEWNIDDLRGGIGVEIADPTKDADRAWWSTAQLRYKGRIILPRLTTQTSTSPNVECQTLTGFKNEMYATFGTAVHVYNNSTDTWGNSVNTLLNNATDAKQGLVGGTETLAIATGSEVDYATDSSTWARNTTDIKYLVFWKDLLWGISQAGQLYYTDDLSAAWSTDALLQLPDNYVTGLLTARRPDGEEAIYAATKVGLFIHDDTNQRFLPTDLQLPFHPDAGKGVRVWRGSIFFPAGNSVYKMQAGGDTTIVVPVGPDRDHGLPSDKRGVIVNLEPTHNDLIALLDASQASGVSAVQSRVSRGVGNHHGVTTNSKRGFSEILGWDERGWEAKWLSTSSGRSLTASEVSSAYGSYRLWWSENTNVYYQSLPVDVVNPLQITNETYGTTATLETPWNDFNIRNQTKVALDVLVETINPTTDETVLVEYATDYSESYTTLGTITTTGETKYRIVVGGNPVGEVFRAIKFRVTMARGTTTTNTPQLIKLTLVWRSVVALLWGVAADIDVNETSPDGRNTKQQIADLKSSLASSTLIEVTYRNDNTESQNYYMDMTDLQSLEEAGGEAEVGIFRTNFIEPRQTRDR
jgi:hypothetical protein